jgi:hypothetical protein
MTVNPLEKVGVEDQGSVACGLSPVSLPVCPTGDATPSSELTYAVGHVERDFADSYGHLDFPRGQKLYRRTWDLVITDLADDYRHNPRRLGVALAA